MVLVESPHMVDDAEPVIVHYLAVHILNFIFIRLSHHPALSLTHKVESGTVRLGKIQCHH